MNSVQRIFFFGPMSSESSSAKKMTSQTSVGPPSGDEKILGFFIPFANEGALVGSKKRG